MNSSDQMNFVVAERRRIQAEYQRRAHEVSADRYASWQPATKLIIEGRRRAAVEMLRRANVFPQRTDKCLEVGCGSHGWLNDLIDWGVAETNLRGIELDPTRAIKARQSFPNADLRLGDAVELPWADGSFKLVICSTLFTSILDSSVRSLIANEIVRVLAPAGALLWYDFAFDNPRNPNVRSVSRRALRKLFPSLRGEIRSVTLAPPLARAIAPRSWMLATLLEKIPMLRTHLLGVLIKDLPKP
jgi:ubiquinone/menaquinone biosynthesis C-methylase UbiE